MSDSRLYFSGVLLWYDGLNPQWYPIEFLEDIEAEMDGTALERLTEQNHR